MFLTTIRKLSYKTGSYMVRVAAGQALGQDALGQSPAPIRGKVAVLARRSVLRTVRYMAGALIGDPCERLVVAVLVQQTHNVGRVRLTLAATRRCHRDKIAVSQPVGY